MKRRYLISVIILFFPIIVLALPNADLSVSASSIENGSSVTATVTLTDTAAWNIRINGSGAASCSTKHADVTGDGKSTTKIFSLSCTSTQEGTIIFTVIGDITSGTAETKDVSLTKTVTVTRARSGDNTLKELKVDGVMVPGFSSSNTSYTLADNSGTSINVSASANDGNARVSGTGSKTLNYGRNSFNIIVTAENGSQKTYTITVNKPDPRSTNNNLKTLTIDKESISFDKNTTNYTIKLEHNVNEINISATAEDSKASVSGTGVKKLSDYINEFIIVVTAENGSNKEYIIKAIRKDKDGNYGKLNEDNSVKSISIKDYDFHFDREIKKYNILVESVKDLEINVEPNDATATVSIENDKDLKPGLNKIIIKIVAENGKENEYLLNVYNIAEEEKTIVEEESKNDEKENLKKIWMIISIVEFVLIILFLLLLLKKKNKNDSSDNNNQEYHLKDDEKESHKVDSNTSQLCVQPIDKIESNEIQQFSSIDKKDDFNKYF